MPGVVQTREREKRQVGSANYHRAYLVQWCKGLRSPAPSATVAALLICPLPSVLTSLSLSLWIYNAWHCVQLRLPSLSQGLRYYRGQSCLTYCKPLYLGNVMKLQQDWLNDKDPMGLTCSLTNQSIFTWLEIKQQKFNEIFEK